MKRRRCSIIRKEPCTWWPHRSAIWPISACARCTSSLWWTPSPARTHGTTQTLLRAYGLERTGAQLLALHQHNEAEAAAQVVDRLRQGQRVAYVSDAGTPAISDPGARLVAAATQAGLPVVPIPGPSSVTAALSVAGIDLAQPRAAGFVFAGFLPSKASERAAAAAALGAEMRAVVLLEAPHRIEASAAALAGLGDRRITVGRELTKQFEQITTLAAGELPAWLAADPNRVRGEFVLVLHPAPPAAATGTDTRVLELLLAELPAQIGCTAGGRDHRAVAQRPVRRGTGPEDRARGLIRPCGRIPVAAGPARDLADSD